MVAIDGLNIATMTIVKTKNGIVWNTSVSRINASSIQPP